jgi:Leucine-rich repeat (LRR) protein
MTDTPALKTFILEDPEGSAAALRAWGGRSLRVESRIGGFDAELIRPHAAGPLVAHGDSLILDYYTEIPARLLAPDTISLRIEPGVIIFRHGPRVGLLSSDGTCQPCVLAISLGSLPRILPEGISALVVTNAGDIRDLSVLRRATSLQHLALHRLGAVAGRQVADNFSHLKSLEVSFQKNRQPKDLAPWASLEQLEWFHVGWGGEDGAEHLASLRNLKSLAWSGCSSPPLRHLEQLNQLTFLKLDGEESNDIRPLTCLTGLESLELEQWSMLTDLSPLRCLHQIRRLNLQYCEGIVDIAPLAELRELEWLDLGWADIDEFGERPLRDYTPLAGLRRLIGLNLACNGFLSDASCLATLGLLRRLSLAGCPRLQSIESLRHLEQLEALSLSGCGFLTSVAPLGSCRSLVHVNLEGSGEVRDIDTLAGAANLRSLAWTEIAAPHSVLAAAATSRGDEAAVLAFTRAWRRSVRLSKEPNTFGLRLVNAYKLISDAGERAEALMGLAEAMRTRAQDDDTPDIITAHTWRAWADVVKHLPGPQRDGAFKVALARLNPVREVLPVMTPVLLALSEVGPPAGCAIPVEDEALLGWIRAHVLAPLAADADLACRAAPAAAALFAGFGLDAEVRVWLDHGTIPAAPHGRDRMLLALVMRAARSGAFLEARRWVGQMFGSAARGEGRRRIAAALATRLPPEAWASLKDESSGPLRRRLGTAIGMDAGFDSATDLYTGLLALDEPGSRPTDAGLSAKVLDDLLFALGAEHPESALVVALLGQLAALARAPTAGGDLGGVTGHPAWTEEVAGRRWAAFTTTLPDRNHLAVEAIAARAVGAGLIEANLAPSLLDRVTRV